MHFYYKLLYAQISRLDSNNHVSKLFFIAIKNLSLCM